ncbi:MAG: response regulator transcription factor [Candidatus Didemnitutus sp.]|nr:response regulator transcription factor [Candidatus Didemnitutus sp.]
MSALSRPLIVVVEDDEELADLICQHLEGAGMQTQRYARCAHALRFLERNFANLLLLDLNLPDSNGFQLFAELRQRDILVPTIFLTGNTIETDKVKGLEMGGDDYITKPFSYPELVARINAVLRRTEAKGDFNLTKNVRTVDQPFDFLGAKIHPERMEVEFPNGTTSPIGRKELGIIAYLNTHRHVVITRKELIHSVWGIHADVRSRSLDQYIVKVRSAFSANGLSLDCFKTVHGIGYIFEPPVPDAAS